jgi:hypothetical protein
VGNIAAPIGGPLASSSELPNPALEKHLQPLVDNPKQDGLKSSTDIEKYVQAPQ